MGIFRDNKKHQQLSKKSLKENYHQRVKYLANTDMPLDFLLAGELAQIQTFVIPSISTLLHRTKQYEQAGTKRLDDTRAILTECMADTVHSERGQTMVEQLNFIHGHYKISNDDYLYTLALFMLEPVRWCESFGYRRLSEEEKQALYLEFRDLGEAMRIKDIPGDFYAMQRWYQGYRQLHMAFDPANRAVTEGLISGMQQMMPTWLRPLTNPFFRALILTLINDAETLQALGIKAPSKAAQWLIKAGMKSRALLSSHINIWQHFVYENSFIYRHYRTYPGGYQTRGLGPDKIMLARKQSESVGCPFHAASTLNEGRRDVEQPLS